MSELCSGKGRFRLERAQPCLVATFALKTANPGVGPFFDKLGLNVPKRGAIAASSTWSTITCSSLCYL